MSESTSDINAVPLESPEDWVTQDRVPARAGIDERRFIDADSQHIGAWGLVGYYSERSMHGDVLAKGWVIDDDRTI